MRRKLFSIDGQKAWINILINFRGAKAILKKYPDSFRICIPTHRSHGGDEWYHENTFKNAYRATTEMVGHHWGFGGVPFYSEDRERSYMEHIVGWGSNPGTRSETMVYAFWRKIDYDELCHKQHGIPYIIRRSVETMMVFKQIYSRAHGSTYNAGNRMLVVYLPTTQYVFRFFSVLQGQRR